MPGTVQRISETPAVRKDLARTTGEKKPGEKVKAGATDKFWFVTHALLLIGCGVAYYLLSAHFVPLPRPHIDLLLRLVRGAVMIIILLAIAKAVSVYAIGRVSDVYTRCTLKR